MLDKIELLSQAEKNRSALINEKDGCKISGASVKKVINNIGDINEYMKAVKTSYHNYVCINPEKCPVNVDIMSMIDYSDEKHIEALLSYQGSTSDLGNDIAIILYDVNKALRMAYEKNLIDKNDLEIIKFLRRGKSKEWISKKKNISRMTLHRKMKKIVVTVKDVLNGKK